LGNDFVPEEILFHEKFSQKFFRCCKREADCNTEKNNHHYIASLEIPIA
jgi:hypothetical protein